MATVLSSSGSKNYVKAPGTYETSGKIDSDRAGHFRILERFSNTAQTTYNLKFVVTYLVRELKHNFASRVTKCSK
jgi:hypothetical protein